MPKEQLRGEGEISRNYIVIFVCMKIFQTPDMKAWKIITNAREKLPWHVTKQKPTGEGINHSSRDRLWIANQKQNRPQPFEQVLKLIASFLHGLVTC